MNIINQVLSDLNLPEIDEIAYEDLIHYYLTDGNPLFLLCMNFKLIEELKAANVIYNDYYDLRNDYLKFKHDATEMINEHSKVIQSQTDAIDKLTDNYDKVMKFLSANRSCTIN